MRLHQSFSGFGPHDDGRVSSFENEKTLLERASTVQSAPRSHSGIPAAHAREQCPLHKPSFIESFMKFTLQSFSKSCNFLVVEKSLSSIPLCSLALFIYRMRVSAAALTLAAVYQEYMEVGTAPRF